MYSVVFPTKGAFLEMPADTHICRASDGDAQGPQAAGPLRPSAPSAAQSRTSAAAPRSLTSLRLSFSLFFFIPLAHSPVLRICLPSGPPCPYTRNTGSPVPRVAWDSHVVTPCPTPVRALVLLLCLLLRGKERGGLHVAGALRTGTTLFLAD